MNERSDKVAILLWLYHIDLLNEFYNRIYPIQDLTDLYIACCEETIDNESIKKLKSLNNLKNINYYPNIGGDLYSFVNDLSLINNKYFIKLHTKKSFWGYKSHCNWRVMLVDSLIGSRKTLKDNLSAISMQNGGALGCGSLIYQKTESVHKNKLRQILKLYNLHDNNYTFIGGNMFLGNTNLYQQYITKYKEELCELLSLEKGKVDEHRNGTYCHSMERILGCIGSLNGLLPANLDSIQIQLENNNIINLRIMYNSELYCLEQPNIYGKIIDHTNNSFSISWYNSSQDIISKYIRIDRNLYINQLHFDDGVYNKEQHLNKLPNI